MECNNQRTAIILVTFNKWELTRACLQDLEDLINDEEHFVVAIADNCSSDGTVERVQEEYPKVRIYPQKSNLGFGAANNAAIQGLLKDRVLFETICLLNNDTRIGKGSLDELSKIHLRIQEELGDTVTVPSIIGKDGKPQHNFFAGYGFAGIGGFQFLLNAFRNKDRAAKYLEGMPRPVVSAKLEEKGISISEIFWASAVCWMVSRNLWEKCGGFDEKIFMYNEDADLALRLRKAGARFVMADTVTLTHLGGGSAQSSLTQALQHDRSQLYVFQKHFGLRGALLSRIFRTLRSSFRIIVSLPQAIFSRDKRQYVKHHLTLLKESIL